MVWTFRARKLYVATSCYREFPELIRPCDNMQCRPVSPFFFERTPSTFASSFCFVLFSLFRPIFPPALRFIRPQISLITRIRFVFRPYARWLCFRLKITPKCRRLRLFFIQILEIRASQACLSRVPRKSRQKIMRNL